MMLSSALVLAALSRSDAFSPSGTSRPTLQRSHELARPSSALTYSHGEDDGEPLLPPELRRKVHLRSTALGPSRRVPRRAIPHVRNASHDEDAMRAGYIIRHGQATHPETGDNDSIRNRGEPQWPAEGGVRPLRSIRRIVHRSHQEQPLQAQGPLPREEPSQIGMQAPDYSLNVNVRNRPDSKRSRLSLSRQPQLDEFLDRPEQLPLDEERKGASRVTFKATQESSKTMKSEPVATLTEYMTQPVSQYSLLSFHDAEDSNDSDVENSNKSKSRRWIVRRLTTEEAQRYMRVVSSDEHPVMDESNLFRLAVPLLPLIGWDLTPVIDLEVIPPQKSNGVCEGAPTNNPGESSSSEWAPLKGIRRRIRDNGDDANFSDNADYSPIVKIRSLRVSLLSTQEEVKAVMSNNNGNPNNRRDSNMQKEALDMVGKVEEWLRPHISFEAELSWDDALCNSGAVSEATTSSAVTVKSTAITSLTIPKLPSGILRKTVPSALIVKRLGATLTSRALAICLPRFLRQLEKDYVRWSGLGLSASSVEENDDVSLNSD